MLKAVVPPLRTRLLGDHLLAVTIVAADQLTKAWVQRTLTLYERKPIFPFLNLTYTRNPGAAFSFLADAGGWQVWFFILLAFGMVLAIIYWLWRLPEEARFERWGLALILGGAIGNLIDRLRYGAVVDFLDFHVGTWHWPAFNVADSAITVGVGFLMVDCWLKEKHDGR